MLKARPRPHVTAAVNAACAFAAANHAETWLAEHFKVKMLYISVLPGQYIF